MSETFFKLGDPVTYRRLSTGIDRRFENLPAVFVRYQDIGGRPMCVIHVRGTISPRQVSIHSIRRP